jgi:hypothetical protein
VSGVLLVQEDLLDLHFLTKQLIVKVMYGVTSLLEGREDVIKCLLVLDCWRQFMEYAEINCYTC